MSEDKIKEALSLQIEEYIPLSNAEAIFDYDVINDFAKDKEQSHLHLNLAAFPKALWSLIAMFSSVLDLFQSLLKWKSRLLPGSLFPKRKWIM